MPNLQLVQAAKEAEALLEPISTNGKPGVSPTYLAGLPGDHTIDITPESLKSPLSAASVTAKMSEWQVSQAEFANCALHFLRSYRNSIMNCFRNDGMESATEDMIELLETAETMATKQEIFLRALAGPPSGK